MKLRQVVFLILLAFAISLPLSGCGSGGSSGGSGNSTGVSGSGK